jgi:flagellar protein FliO/FliZ
MKQFIILLLGICAFSVGWAEETLPEKSEETALTLTVAEPVRAAAVDDIKIPDAKIPESKIPVLTKQKEKAAATSSPYFRMFMSLFVIGGMALGLVFFTKWYGRRATGKTAQQKIQMLSQMHLGPRKSLAVVRISGESLLIGITDQNIRLIKTLSLLDDETPEFKDHLAEPTDSADELDLSSIKDQITRKTSTMRPFA